MPRDLANNEGSDNKEQTAIVPIPETFILTPEIENSAADANAATFISTFPHNYATYVGPSGLQLSGGQKQR